jgi:hypothetical protein
MRVGEGGRRIRPPFFPGSTGWATAGRRRRSNIYIALYNLSSPRQHGSLCRRPLWRGNRADQQRISSPGKYWIESLVSRPSSHRAVSCWTLFILLLPQLMGLVLHVRRKSQQEKRLRHHYYTGSERATVDCCCASHPSRQLAFLHHINLTKKSIAIILIWNLTFQTAGKLFRDARNISTRVYFVENVMGTIMYAVCLILLILYSEFYHRYLISDDWPG